MFEAVPVALHPPVAQMVEDPGLTRDASTQLRRLPRRNSNGEGLSDADAQQLERQGAYMQATGVQRVPH